MSIGHFNDFDQSWRKFYDNKRRNGTFVNHFACMFVVCSDITVFVFLSDYHVETVSFS